MNELLEKILKFLQLANKRKFVEFRFMILNGTEPNKQIKIANTVQYEFINSGGSLVKLNNGIILYPFYTGIMPFSWKGEVHANESDETIYEYDFTPLQGGEPVLGYIYTANTASNTLIKYDNSFGFGNINRLTVILKQLSNKQH